MPQDIYVYLTSNEVAKVVNCTGDPTLEIETIQDGFYRDIFTAADSTDLFFSGTAGVFPGTAKSVAAPPVINGGIIAIGAANTDYTVNSQLADDTEATVKATNFKITNSDEFAHEPLREQEYPITYWAFPTDNGGTVMNMRFRTTLVKGWGNAPSSF